MRSFLLLFFLLSFSSCAVLDSLDEISTLQEYSKERDAMAGDVAHRDELFRALLSKVRANASFAGYQKKDFIREFGEPVLIKYVERSHRKTEAWLYRQTVYKGGPKVYVFFTHDGKWDGLTASGMEP